MPGPVRETGAALEGGRDAPRAPRVLLISGLYPSEANPVFGAFIARQHEALERAGVTHRLVVNRDWRPGAARGLWKYGSLLVRAVAAAARRDIDVVLAHFLYPSALIGRIAASIAGVPYVVVAHGTDVDSVARPGALARACLRATDRAASVVTNSHATAARIASDLGLADDTPVEVLTMGVDRALFGPDPGARAAIGWPPGPTVLFAGNLIPRKAPDVLLDAMAIVRDEVPGARLVVAGDGPLRGDLAAMSSRLGLDVLFAGALTQTRLAEAMAAADVFVLPSRAEPLGVVLLEAMACGTPCVASAVGGIPEILGDGCGELVAPGDPRALAAGVLAVLARGKDAYRDACLAAAEANDLDRATERLVGVLSRVATTRK